MSDTEYAPTCILFTGGAGFIGSNVMVHLVLKYPDVKMVCLDKLNYCANVKNFEEIKDKKNFTFVKGDILAADLVNYLIEAHAVDTIMHFAAETHVDNSFGQSLQFTRNNVLGTHVLLESAKAHQKQIRRFIHVSTDEVYGESTMECERHTEQAEMAPTNPYAASKAAAEHFVKSYLKSFNLPVIITRGNNVYGPKQYPEKLIPKFINLLQQRKPCPIHGSGENRRSYLYVQDVAEAFDKILTRGEIGRVYNIGSEEEITNLGVLQRLLPLFGLDKEKDKYIRYARDRAFNDFRYHIDNASLRQLGWGATVGFEQGLKLTREWYVSHSQYWGDISFALQAHPSTNTVLNASEQLSDKPISASESSADEAPKKRQKVAASESS